MLTLPKTLNWHEFFKENKMVVYRIIPHTSVTNNTNRKIWRILHKLYEVYDSPSARLDIKFKGGFKISYREKDTIWFDIVFRQVEGEKKVEFYVSTTELWAKKFREVIEDRMKVTIEETSIDDLQVPQENTVIQELKYIRHDIFSMNTNATEQTSPISSVLSALDDVTFNGDYARLSIAAETMSRIKWSKLSSYAHEKLTKGKIPQRNRLSPALFSRHAQNGIVWLINEVNGIIQDTLQGISKAFFKSDENDKKNQTELIEKPKDDIFGNMKKSLDKRYQPVWKTRIRVAAHSEEKLRRDLIANTISGAFSEIGEENELTTFTVRIKARKNEIINELNTLKLSSRSKADGDVNLVSCDEMSKIAMQLPTREVQQRYEEALKVNRKVETEIPNIVANEKGILVGHAEHKGEQIPISIPLSNLDEAFRSYGFVGAPRTGKDTLIKNMVVEGALKHKISSIVFDPIMEDGNRGMADGIRDALPPKHIIDLDLSDENYYPPMDLTEVIKKLGRRGANRFALELIDFFGDVETMGQSRKILREFALAARGSIYDIKLLLENEDYRIKRIKELRKDGQERLASSLDKWTSEWGGDSKGNLKLVRDGQKALDGKASAILNRLDEFLGDPDMLNIFAQDPHPELDFEKWMMEGKVIIIRVPNRKLGVLNTKTLIHWISLKVFMTKLLMSPNDSKTFIVFNEPHQYLTPGLKNLMGRIILEGPKWRLAGMFAFHHFGKLDYGLDDDLISGGINWFLFANDNKKVFERLDEQLKPTFDMESATGTEAYHPICILRYGGRRQNPFLMKALAPPTERYPMYDNSFLTKRHSRMYGRHWQAVEKMIMLKEDLA